MTRCPILLRTLSGWSVSLATALPVFVVAASLLALADPALAARPPSVTPPPVATSAPPPAQLAVDLPAKDVRLKSDFEEVRRVGAPDVLFTRIAAGRFGDDGTLYVIDQGLDMTRRLLAVWKDGSVHEVGQAGQGPGEFSALSHAAPMPGGRVAAFDAMHGAYQIFGRDGSFERMVKTEDGAGASGMAMFNNAAVSARSSWRGDDLLSLREVVFDLSEIEEGEMRASAGAVLERIGLDGDVATTDTVLVAWRPPPEPGHEIGMPGMSLRTASMFAPKVRYDAAYDGAIVFSDSTAYAIKVATADGDVERVLRRPFTATPVNRRIRQRAKVAMREQLEAELEAGDVRAAMFAQLRTVFEDQIDNMAFHEEISVVKELKAGWDNSIWVQRASEETPWDERASGPVDVLARDGRYVGTFSVADEALPLALGPDGLAAYVEIDALDQPTLVLKRLPPELR